MYKHQALIKINKKLTEEEIELFHNALKDSVSSNRLIILPEWAEVTWWLVS